MDNLTHALVGVAIARAGFQGRVPFATALGVVAANAPDFDLLAGVRGVRYLQYHRGVAHSIYALPLWTLFFVVLLAAVERWRGRRPAARVLASAGLLAFLAVASHLALDWTNGYGIRLFAPFSRHWYAADWMPILDPWLWLVLGLVLGLPLVLAVAVREMEGRGVAPRPCPHCRSGAVALLCVVGWVGFRSHEHARAIVLLNDSALALQQPAQPAVAALPRIPSPFDWQGILASPGRYDTADVSTREGGRVGLAATFLKPALSPAIAAAEATPAARVFLSFARFPLADQQNGPQGTRVTFTDLRYSSSPARPGMGVTVILGPRLEVVSQQFGWGR